MILRVLYQFAPWKKQFCPICKEPVEWVTRYPDYVCENCINRATDANGRAITFQNDNPLGFGVIAKYQDSEECCESEHCVIDGVECKANEVRFGGIVIQKT